MEYIGDILYDDKLLQANRHFIIFGAGLYGRKVLQYLDLNGLKKNVICFCESGSEKEGQEVDGVMVRRFDTICHLYPDAEYLISGKYSKEIYQYLRENFIEKIHILLM